MKRLSETDQLESQLGGLGNAIRRQYLLEGFVRLLSFVLLGLVGLFILDYITRMPLIVRLVLLVVGIGYGIYWFIQNFYKKYQRQLSPQEVSLLVEKANPGLQSRMISTLQFQEAQTLGHGTSENLVEGLVNQTFQMIREVQFSSAIDKKWVKGAMKLFLISGVLFLASGVVGRTSFLVFFQRFTSSEVNYPTKTKITDVTFDNVNKSETLRIPEGEKIVVRVTAEGELPPMGKINIQAESGGEIDYDLKFDETKKIFISEIDPITEKVEITIFLGDDQWGPKTIHVIPRPKIISLVAKITPPKYTGKAEERVTSGNMQVFEGSIVDIELKSDKDLISFDFVELTKDSAKTALVSKDPRTWTLQLKVENNIKYTFLLVDKEKLNSHEVPIYTLSVDRDKAPAIKILKPMAAIEASPETKVPVKLQIVDDYLVTGYRVKAQAVGRNEQGEEVLKGQPKTLAENVKIRQKTVEYTGMWALSLNGAVPGDRVKMWVEAWDNHEKDPLIMKSQEVYVSVISAEEYRLRLLTRFGDGGKLVDTLVKDLQGSDKEIDDLNK